MINYFLAITFYNISSFVFGILFGIILPSIIVLFIFERKMKKNSKNKKIYDISLENYKFNFKDKINIKDGIIKEANDVSKLIYKDSEKPIYELSINDLFFAIDITTIKLNRIINNPIMKNMKNIHISKLIEIKDNLYKPIKKVFKNKFVKALYLCYRFVITILNIFNPLFYIRMISNKIFIKKGKQEFIIYALNQLGETFFDTYSFTNK